MTPHSRTNSVCASLTYGLLLCVCQLLRGLVGQQNDVIDLRSIGESFGFTVLDSVLKSSRDEFVRQQIANLITHFQRTNPSMAELLRSIPEDILISSIEEASQPQPTGNQILDILGKNGIAVLPSQNRYSNRNVNGNNSGNISRTVGFTDVLSGVLSNVWLNNGVSPTLVQASNLPPQVESTNPRDPLANRLLVPRPDQAQDLRSIILRKLALRQLELQRQTSFANPPNPFSVPLPDGSNAFGAGNTPLSPFSSQLSQEANLRPLEKSGKVWVEPRGTKQPPKRSEQSNENEELTTAETTIPSEEATELTEEQEENSTTRTTRASTQTREPVIKRHFSAEITKKTRALDRVNEINSRALHILKRTQPNSDIPRTLITASQEAIDNQQLLYRRL